MLFRSVAGEEPDQHFAVQGDMPRGKQFGYIFKSDIEDIKGNIYHTIAHELGHGRWRLYHPFSKEYGEKIPVNATENLMDYKGGIHLAKWQWNQMANPAWFTNPFEGDEESMKVLYGFSSEENKKKFDAVFNKLLRIEEFKKVFDLIKDETMYKYMVMEDLYTSDGTRSGAATSLKFNNREVFFNSKTRTFETISFAYLDNEKNEVTYFDITDQGSFISYVELLKLSTNNGYIFLDMDKVDQNVVFHEFNHAAQFILNHKAPAVYTYNVATMEVETRMIIFYAAFKNADEKTRKDSRKMREHLIKFYGLNGISSFGIFFGESDHIKITLEGDNPLGVSGAGVYEKLTYVYFNDLLLTGESNPSDTFNKLMKDYARYLRRNGYSTMSVPKDGVFLDYHLLKEIIKKSDK